jgi:RNA polymerase-associated protein RTF1
MEMSSSDDEDGQISKQEEEEERQRRLYGDRVSTKKNKEEDSDEITSTDLLMCRITREMIAKHCMAPWFEDYVTGE